MRKLLVATMVFAATMGAAAQTKYYMGGDISNLPTYEAEGVPYYTSSAGTKAGNGNVIKYLKETAKMNSMRVRLFVNPDKSATSSTQQDLDYVTRLCKRIKALDLSLMLDIHYSDTWADPGAQSIPSAWTTNTSNAALKDSVYNYTKRCLEHLVANDAQPDFVQVGNEISYGMLWRKQDDHCYTSDLNATSWQRFTNFLKAGAQAVREVTPEAKIIIHTERAGNTSTTKAFYNKMKMNGVDYDIIGLSYYPFWHKNLATLGSTLNMLATTFPDKDVHIVETAYYYQYFPTGSDVDDTTGTWPATVDGQAQFIEDLCAELAKHDNVKGLYYWYPEENGSSKLHWQNRGLWNNKTHTINKGLLRMKKFLLDKEAVGINKTSPDNTGSSDDAIYNMCGQRVESMTAPGLYIKGKKKVLVQ